MLTIEPQQKKRLWSIGFWSWQKTVTVKFVKGIFCYIPLKLELYLCLAQNLNNYR